MSAQGMQAQVIAAYIVENLASDKEHGYDLEAGMFGPNLSAFIRELAAMTLPNYPERLYTMAEMEQYGRAYADTRDKRRTETPAIVPQGVMGIPPNPPGSGSATVGRVSEISYNAG